MKDAVGFGHFEPKWGNGASSDSSKLLAESQESTLPGPRQGLYDPILISTRILGDSHARSSCYMYICKYNRLTLEPGSL